MSLFRSIAVFNCRRNVPGVLRAGWLAGIISLLWISEGQGSEAAILEPLQVLPASATAAVADPAAPAVEPAPLPVNSGPANPTAASTNRWFQWGAGFRWRQEYYRNATTLDHEAPNSTQSLQRYRVRLWAAIRPLDTLNLRARLSWEGRYYFEPAALEGMDWDEILLDQFYFQWTSPGNHTATVTVGRQDIVFGNRWLIYDGTTVDGSRTDFFDAARLTLAFPEAKTVLDAIYLDQNSDAGYWLPPINNQFKPLTEENTRGAILYLANRSLPQTQLEGYFIYKHDTKALARGYGGDLFVFGGRVEGSVGPHWKHRGEFAPQLGSKNGNAVGAFGFNSRIGYFINDSLNNNFRLGYEYLSGDDPHTANNEGFDSLWGRRAQWSELLVPTWALETGGRRGDWTNLQRVGLGWSLNPASKWEVLVDYHLLFANENPMQGRSGFSDSGRFRGQLLAGVLKYTWSSHLSGHLWSEWFFPGDYYQAPRTDTALFLRAQFVVDY